MELSQRKAGQLPADQVQMEVGDRLPGMHAGVDDQPVAFFGQAFLRCQFFRHHDHVADQWLIPWFQFVDRVNVPVGDDENMGGCKRMCIAKGRDEVVAIENCGGGFARDDFTEDTGHSWLQYVYCAGCSII